MPVFYHSVLLPDMIDMIKKTLSFLVLNTIWQNPHSAWEMPFFFFEMQIKDLGILF